MFQEILIVDDRVRVNNIVSFGDSIGQLKVRSFPSGLLMTPSTTVASQWKAVNAHYSFAGGSGSKH